jgi:hypothetical protein
MCHFWSLKIDKVMLETGVMLNHHFTSKLRFIVVVINMDLTVQLIGVSYPTPVSHPCLGGSRLHTTHHTNPSKSFKQSIFLTQLRQCSSYKKCTPHSGIFEVMALKLHKCQVALESRCTYITAPYFPASFLVGLIVKIFG